MSTLEMTDVRCAIDELQCRYIDALDSKDMEAWLACFSEREEASYFCQSAENAAMDWPICLMLDDCRARLKDRVIFVTKIWKGTFQDYRTRHFIQRLSVEQVSRTLFKARSNFSIEFTLDPHPAAPLATGVYEDTIAIEEGVARFVEKRAIYDTTVLPQYIVYPF